MKPNKNDLYPFNWKLVKEGYDRQCEELAKKYGFKNKEEYLEYVFKDVKIKKFKKKKK